LYVLPAETNGVPRLKTTATSARIVTNQTNNQSLKMNIETFLEEINLDQLFVDFLLRSGYTISKKRPTRDQRRWSRIIAQLQTRPSVDVQQETITSIVLEQPVGTQLPVVDPVLLTPPQSFIRLTPRLDDQTYAAHFPVDGVVPLEGDVVELVVTKVTPQYMELELRTKPPHPPSGMKDIPTWRKQSDYV
jgi:hypothetical protein